MYLDPPLDHQYEDAEIAEFYQVDLDEITDNMRMNYAEDRDIDAAIEAAERRAGL
jgi:hypothetical protein